MSSRRILDFLSLASTTKSILSHHLRIRSHQLDVYTKTSSVLRPLIGQQQRVYPSTKQHEQPSQNPDTTPTDGSSVSPGAHPQLGNQAKSTDIRSEDVQSTNAERPRSQVPKTTAHPDRSDVAASEKPSGTPVTTATSTVGTGDEDIFIIRNARHSSVLPKIPNLKRRLAPGAVPEIVSHPALVWKESRDHVPKPNTAMPEPAVKAAVLEKKHIELSSVQSENIEGQSAAQAPMSKSEDAQLSPSPNTKGQEASKEEEEELIKNITSTLETPSEQSILHTQSTTPITAKPSFEMSASRVPSSRISRLFHYGGLAAGMTFGALSESIKRATVGGGDAAQSIMFSEANVGRLVKKLSRMRGAALKLGQMLSFQDSKMLPPAIHTILTRVQDSADYMPPAQRNSVLSRTLGSDWSSLFTSFSETPIAAASIGQVHTAILASTGLPVAVKIQYPGVKQSIDSDLNNLSLLLTASKLLPKGMYLDKTIANARVELAWECDYVREAAAIEKFRELLSQNQCDRDTFVVPKVIPEASGTDVLTMEFMHGTGVTKLLGPQGLTQKEKDYIGTSLLWLSLREIAEFKYMQTDPNWSNFLWNPRTRKIELLDFGASRSYPDSFVALYLHLLRAAVRKDFDACVERSQELGYLTGMEGKSMVKAHVDSMFILAEPFRERGRKYDFGEQTVTERVRALIPVMVRERLTPPPEETYSLHRKLSGAFLLCARLGSRVECGRLWEQIVGA